MAAGSHNLFPAGLTDRISGQVVTVGHTALVSLKPSDLFSVLDLDLPELSAVRNALERKGHNAALAALLRYYRARYPEASGVSGSQSEENPGDPVSRADDLGRHIFQWGPYPPAAYGDNIDWAADPAKDIEWVAAIYRFFWANDLADAYLATGNERYAKIFIDLTADWIRKHPLEKTVDIVHPVYGWNGYPWLDLQTGIRAANLCNCFRVFVHSTSFTPGFLGVLLASLYDHEVKTEKMPMGKVHNKAIFEQRGFINVIHTFPEFRDKKRWLDISAAITCENLLAQTTTDGVQREWCGGYHSEVYHDALEIETLAADLGFKMPAYYHDRVKGMADYVFCISTPDLGFPMFGDTSRGKVTSDDRKSWELYKLLKDAGKKYSDPKFVALADLNTGSLPANGSFGFSDAGFYAMRNNWTPGQVYMALHCSPPSINPWHDQPDNGTFELYAYGRWLMPDTGFYTYGHDADARAWHRQTRVHATMTLNGKDTNVIGRQLLWRSHEDQDVLSVENQSYEVFLHRRTVWFAGKTGNMPFFVILDEANGDSEGDLAIHFPLAPGPVKVDNGNNRITTGFNDVNLLIQISGKHQVSLVKDDGWYSWEYGRREARTAVSAVYKGKAPFVFVSLLVPYRGEKVPECRLVTDPATLLSGMDPVELEVEIAGTKQILSRKMETKE